MQWSDQAIIINVKKFGESSAIINLLSKNYGLHKGVVRNLFSKNSIATFQIGNLVEASWNARLPEHIGNFNLELTKQIIGYVIDDHLKLLLLQSTCAIIDDCLSERQVETTIYNDTINFLNILRHEGDFLKYYIKFELDLLSSLGFGLDLTECTVTGAKDDLAYVSPKTARAVSREVGLPYHHKLLPLPDFLIKEHAGYNHDDLIKGLNLSGYFLYKHFYHPRNFNMPESRSKILAIYLKKLNQLQEF